MSKEPVFGPNAVPWVLSLILAVAIGFGVKWAIGDSVRLFSCEHITGSCLHADRPAER